MTGHAVGPLRAFTLIVALPLLFMSWPSLVSLCRPSTAPTGHLSTGTVGEGMERWARGRGDVSHAAAEPGSGPSGWAPSLWRCPTWTPTPSAQLRPCRLNPWVGKGADYVRANATICLKNGSPIPKGLVTAAPEPSEPSDSRVGHATAGH